jgi:thiol:disulfide interchange protein
MPVLVALILPGCSRPTAESPSNDSGTNAAPIEWRDDCQAALREAQEVEKPLMVDVFATWCVPCKRLDEAVWPKGDIVDASTAFVPVKIDGDKHPDLRDELSVTGYPTVIFLASDGREVHRVIGAADHTVMLKEMRRAAEKAGVSLPDPS